MQIDFDATATLNANTPDGSFELNSFDQLAIGSLVQTGPQQITGDMASGSPTPGDTWAVTGQLPWINETNGTGSGLVI